MQLLLVGEPRSSLQRRAPPGAFKFLLRNLGIIARFDRKTTVNNLNARSIAMLTTLRIKNLALVAELTLDIQPGLNIISGETGAGKSIITGALDLVLGGRADRMLIRSGADTCSVEGLFDTARLDASLKLFLEENGLDPCEEGQLVLKRVITQAGSNRQFVNGSPTTLAVLATLGQRLVDLHRPHDRQSLFQAADQLAILDAYGDLAEKQERVAALVRRRNVLEAEKGRLIVDEQSYARQLDLLRFQVHEINSANLRADEEADLLDQHQRASNSARLLELAQLAMALLSNNEDSLIMQAGTLGRVIADLQRIDPKLASLSDLHSQAVALLNELQRELSHYADRLELDPERLKELEQRLDIIQSLKRKYGRTLQEIIAFGEEAARQLRGLEAHDEELARIDAALNELNTQLWQCAHDLSARRQKVVSQLSKAVVRELATLGFQQSHFNIAISSLAAPEESSSAHRIAATGLDVIEFLFTPNPGEPPRPLRAIASSGEMARVMLALKSVLAAEDSIPVLVFDEVDANVGGETARAVGEKLRQISQSHQVLCITHSPQVAACASAHYVVSKRLEAGRSLTDIVLVEGKERITELARMLGGQSDAALAHAEALMRQEGERSGSPPAPQGRRDHRCLAKRER